MYTCVCLSKCMYIHYICLHGNLVVHGSYISMSSHTLDMYRRDRLWIAMEYCGGGSLQDIYHGELDVSKPLQLDVILLWSPSSVIVLSLSLSLSLSLGTRTGLNELQIAFVCREILRVHTFIIYAYQRCI